VGERNRVLRSHETQIIVELTNMKRHVERIWRFGEDRFRKNREKISGCPRSLNHETSSDIGRSVLREKLREGSRHPQSLNRKGIDPRS
jgi:hypothetical protein